MYATIIIHIYTLKNKDKNRHMIHRHVIYTYTYKNISVCYEQPNALFPIFSTFQPINLIEASNQR